MRIEYKLLPESKRKAPPSDESSLGFGQWRTNHMFLMEYSDGEWHSPRIEPYGPIPLMPGAMGLHYGQTLFEGIKAFKHPDGEIYTFRADKNAERLNVSANVVCMPTVPTDVQLEAIHRLIDVERVWCPSVPQSSLYIRPFMFASQDMLGVKPSKQYYFCVILSPSGAYYGENFAAIRLLVTKQFHRAAAGGTGSSKCGGNYASSLRAGEYAKASGADQVLYLNEANTHIEEVGSMNHYHVRKDGTFVIPEFTETILRSITSLSVLELASLGIIKARQEHIPLDAFINDIRSGEITEAGGFGTAAVVSPVGEYLFEDGTSVKVGDGKPGPHTKALYERYASYQTGKTPAPEGWLAKVAHY